MGVIRRTSLVDFRLGLILIVTFVICFGIESLFLFGWAYFGPVFCSSSVKFIINKSTLSR